MLLITFDLFLKEPPVWPDEAGLVQIASLSKGNLVEDYQRYPSAYPIILSKWFLLSGISIDGQRSLSVLAGSICIIVFCLLITKISKTLVKNSYFSIFSTILLITDFTFLQSTRVGRPEIFTLLFGVFAIYFLLLFVLDKYRKIYLLVLSLISAVFAFTFHINGLIYIVTVLTTTILYFKRFPNQIQKIIAISSIVSSPFLIYLGLCFKPTIATTIARLKIADAQNTWLITVFQDKPLEFKLIYLSFIIISILFFIYTVNKRAGYLYPIAFTLALSWLILIFNKDFWYAVYLVPIVLLIVPILLDHYYPKRIRFFGLIFVCIILFLSNLIFQFKILLQEGGNKYSYQKYIQEIQKIVPDGKSVYTSAIPDPYYAFINRKNNYLERFPQGFVKKEDYLKKLDETDFIIYNGPYGSNYYGNIVMDYLKINYLKISEIGIPDQYQAIIAELKPRNQRVNP